MSKITNDSLNHRMLHGCTNMATVGVNGLDILHQRRYRSDMTYNTIWSVLTQYNSRHMTGKCCKAPFTLAVLSWDSQKMHRTCWCSI